MSIDYDLLKELADKAKPGPWEVKTEETSTCGDLIEGLAAWVEADNERVFGCGMEIEEDEELTNLALAALAPDMARELLDLRDGVEQQITHLEALLAAAEATEHYGFAGPIQARVIELSELLNGDAE